MNSPVDPGRLYGRGLAFPPRIGPDGRVAWSEGAQNIRESIRIILSTALEERVLLPDFGGGLQEFLFQPNIVATHRLIQERVTRALALWEPRIAVTDVRVGAQSADPDAAVVSISYRLVATGADDQIGLTIPLGGG